MACNDETADAGGPLLASLRMWERDGTINMVKTHLIYMVNYLIYVEKIKRQQNMVKQCGIQWISIGTLE